MDKITVSGIEFWAYHGVLESEQEQGQRFMVDVSFTMDSSCCDDEITNTVHYGELAQDIVAFCQEKSYRLIETLVNALAQHLLLRYPLIQEISLTLHKPNAPIPLPFSDVSIAVTRSRTVCFLGVGSNLGDRESYLRFVSEEIEKNSHIELMETSTYLETKPYGVTDQPDFLNAVLQVNTTYTPMQLLSFCQELEAKAGRVKTRRWGERTLDVDILFFGKSILDVPNLTIPHPQIQNRSFVLLPLCEIAPSFIHPVLGKTVQELLYNLQEGETRFQQSEEGRL